MDWTGCVVGGGLLECVCQLVKRVRKSLSEIVCVLGLAHHHANSMQTRISAFHFFHCLIRV